MASTLLKPLGADAVGGQTHGDKIECSFVAGVTSSGRLFGGRFRKARECEQAAHSVYGSGVGQFHRLSADWGTNVEVARTFW